MLHKTVTSFQHHLITIEMAAFDAAAGFYVAVVVVTLLIVFATVWVWLSTRRS